MEKLSQRTLSTGKDYKNPSKDYKLQTPALYFPNQFPSCLPLLLPFPLFLSKKDDLPRGIITNEGLNKKTLLFFPLLLLVPLSLFPSFQPVLFMESFSHFHLLSFLSSVPSAMLLSLVFFPKDLQYAMEVISL